MRDSQCKCGHAIVMSLLLLSTASCERESVIEVGCPPPPDDRILVAIRVQRGMALGTAEVVSDEYELGALLEVTTSGSLRKVKILNGVSSAKAREVPIEVLALITKLGARADAEVTRRAADKGIQLSEWIQDRTKVDVSSSQMRALEDPEKVLNDDHQAVELIRKEGAKHKFLIASAVVYGTDLSMKFDPGPQNPIGFNAFRMDRMNVHVGFSCERLTRIRRLFGVEEGKIIPVLVQYSEVKYDDRRSSHLEVVRENND